MGSNEALSSPSSSWDYVVEYGDRPPPWRRLLVERILRLTARRTPNLPAVYFEDRVITWAELDALADRAADGLLKQGLAVGDVVALSATNSPETFAMMFGIPRANMVVVPINPLNTPTEVEFQLKEAGAKLVISEDGLSVREVIARGEQVVHESDVEETSPYWVRFTSGTTGLPRAFPNFQRNITLQALYMALDLGYRSDDVFLVTAPLAHAAFNFALAAVQVGAPVVLRNSFDPKSVWEECDTYGITQMFMVPTMLSASLDSPGEGHSIRTITVSGSALSPALRARAEARLPDAAIDEFYGTSELGALTVLRGYESEGREGSVGLPRFGAEVRILDDNGEPVPVGEVGTIYVQGPIMTSGFIGSVPPPENVARNGWITAGDMGRLDEDGYLYLADRRSDLILSGGMNVYPAEVENALIQVDGVREVVVVGIPDDHWGQKVTAVITGDVSEEVLDAHCRQVLAAYKIPRKYAFVGELPKSPAGKLLRRLVREQQS